MKILDRYIIRNVLLTFLFIIIAIQVLSVIIDLTYRIHRLESNQGSIKEALIHYYPFWSIWLANTFSPIALFLSVIFFSSRLTQYSEYIPILGSGISFKRITIPYLVSSSIIGLGNFTINYSLLPLSNKIKNKFHYKYLASQKYKYGNIRTISTQISKNEYIFIRNFSRKKNIGYECVYQKFNGKRLVYILKSKTIFWSIKYRKYILSNYIETYIRNNNNKDFSSTSKGIYLEKYFSISPEELLPEEYIAETMTTPELKKFIEIERKRGSKNINSHLNEYYQRTSLPFSTLIFTILGLSISSVKKKGETENNLMIGIILAFLYVFFIEITKIYSEKDYFPSYLFIWLPNGIFGIIAIFLYCKKIN
ncbi:LptF/LptG family permease [Blattabacterium cuenoti]|uniref:LptF/LptG family permease n=1 Tax=Blattabacterium cuenoti TaxID=1653831 RepID=UPI00163C0FFA|nr:LptF/LptG family permease [Blattabacterium cuenoti]